MKRNLILSGCLFFTFMSASFGQYFEGKISCEFIYFADSHLSKISPDNDTFLVDFHFCKDTIVWVEKKNGEIRWQIGKNQSETTELSKIPITESLIDAASIIEKEKSNLKSKMSDNVRYLFQIENDGYNVWIDEKRKYLDSEKLGGYFNLFFQREGLLLDYIRMNGIDIEERRIKSIEKTECSCQSLMKN